MCRWLKDTKAKGKMMGSFRIRDRMIESSHLRLMGKWSSGSLFSEAVPVPWQGGRMGFLRRAPVVTCDVC